MKNFVLIAVLSVLTFQGVSAGEFKINGKFLPGGADGLPYAWVHNKFGGPKADNGTVVLNKVSDKEYSLGVLASSKYNAHIITTLRKYRPAPGDKLEISALVKGKGAAMLGIYAFATIDWTNVPSYKPIKLSEKEFVRQSAVLAVPQSIRSSKGVVPCNRVAIVLWTGKNSEVFFRDVQIRKLKSEKPHKEVKKITK